MADLSDDPALGPLGAGEGRKKFNTGSLVMILVIVVACGGLWIMRNLTRVSATVGGNTEVENAIERFINAAKPQGPGGTKSNLLISTEPGILEVLNESYTQRQVALSDVKRDPFIIPGETQMAGPVDTGDPNRAMTKQRADRKAALEAAGGKLQLKSVIMSSEPLANISNKLVRQGADLTVGSETFRVKEITSDSVLLECVDAALDVTVQITLTIKR